MRRKLFTLAASASASAVVCVGAVRAAAASFVRPPRGE
jgi:hypothetical protein